MKFVSTRGQAPGLGFIDAFLAGLARDGGLYVPEHWPALDFGALRGASFVDTAVAVASPFVAGEIEPVVLRGVFESAYARFRHPAVAPLVQLDEKLWVQELFHGPTLAFKDVAMQAIGGLFEHVLAQRGERVTIVTATSGDTGGAAIEALRGRAGVELFVLHPKGRVSDVQRRQMTTVTDANVHNLAVGGTFDDCQALVKAMFNDAAFRDSVRLSGVNSINVARILPQATYYATAALALQATADRPVRFSVPTGNFGDVYAGYLARRMGVPIDRLVVATNQNDILARTLNAGDHSLGEVHPTVSPSMDIQVSSNFERLLFDVYGRDASAVRSLMSELASSRRFTLPDAQRAAVAEWFSAVRCDESQTLDTMRRVHADAGYLLDPHTAVGVHAAEHARAASGDHATPTVVLATAHPAKFPGAVERATGALPALPPHLADLRERPERCEDVANDLAAVQACVRERVG